MKKLVIASAIAMVMSAGSAMAAAQQGNVEFLGVVSQDTCDLGVSQNGAVNNVLELGTVAPTKEGKPVAMKLVAKDPAQCQLGAKKAIVRWTGNLTTDGIANQNGTAGNSHVILTAVNSADQAKIDSSHSTVSFDDANGKLTNGDGLQFTAKLKAGSTAGTFQSAAAYAVEYK